MGRELQSPDDYNGFLDFMENLGNCLPISFFGIWRPKTSSPEIFLGIVQGKQCNDLRFKIFFLYQVLVFGKVGTLKISRRIFFF